MCLMLHNVYTMSCPVLQQLQNKFVVEKDMILAHSPVLQKLP